MQVSHSGLRGRLVTVYSAHTATCDHKEARNTIDDFIDFIASCYIIIVTLSTLR